MARDIFEHTILIYPKQSNSKEKVNIESQTLA